MDQLGWWCRSEIRDQLLDVLCQKMRVFCGLKNGKRIIIHASKMLLTHHKRVDKKGIPLISIYHILIWSEQRNTFGKNSLAFHSPKKLIAVHPLSVHRET